MKLIKNGTIQVDSQEGMFTQEINEKMDKLAVLVQHVKAKFVFLQEGGSSQTGGTPDGGGDPDPGLLGVSQYSWSPPEGDGNFLSLTPSEGCVKFAQVR